MNTVKIFDRISRVRLHKPNDGEGECMSTSDPFIDYMMHHIQNFQFGERDNISLFPAYSHPDVPADENIIMEFIDPKGQSLFFTTNGFTVPGHGFIHYKDIGHHDWGSPVSAGRNYKEYVRLFLRNRPPIEFHVGKNYSVRLGFFIMELSKAKNRQAKSPTGTSG